MKTVLCFGDSNTWGFDPDASAASPFPLRHAPDVRWTGVLARTLGAEWRVIEEGQNGRTTVFIDPTNPHRVGRDYLPAALESHKPIDVVVLMLGTNDTKAVFNAPAGMIAECAGLLARLVLTSDAGPGAKAPRVLLVSPPLTGSFAHLPELAEKFAGAAHKTRRFPELYRRVAETLGCGFLNAQEHTTPSPTDDLHLDATSHQSLGAAIAAAVRAL